jgi:hypothetical protein
MGIQAINSYNLLTPAYMQSMDWWRIEPLYDGISTTVTSYKIVDHNGALIYMGDRIQCEYYLQK